MSANQLFLYTNRDKTKDKSAAQRPRHSTVSKKKLTTEDIADVESSGINEQQQLNDSVSAAICKSMLGGRQNVGCSADSSRFPIAFQTLEGRQWHKKNRLIAEAVFGIAIFRNYS